MDISSIFRTLPLLVASVLTFTTTAFADEPRSFPHPDRIHYDAQCLTIDGKDVMIFSGAFHYFRCPKELWQDRFQKIKDAGFNCVETYVAWNLHEREMPAGPDDFSKITGLQDLDDWLTMAEKFGLYVIIRPGPYICAEWDNGGFPQWLELKKPAAPLRESVWLRTDDPVFLTWSKHWYDAVCPIIAKHQITRKARGETGVILFQIENEYDFWRFDNDKARVNSLTALATDALADGIDVPLITCHSHQIFKAKTGPLRSVFNCVNFYPRWNIENDLGKAIPALRIDQPDAPLATTELQGGWFAQVGGMLSQDQDGITAAQIQNITLYAWQMGDTITNYYMLFGGTNFDDWAARSLITSYDYNAPIREHGGVGDRYQRVWALGHMLQEHGPKLSRAQAVEIEATATDKDVEIAERRAPDGSRYLFVRTQNNSQPRSGTAHVKEKNSDASELAFDYKLEPFGSLVLYLPPGVNDVKQGQWLPKLAPEIEHPTNLPSSVQVTQAQRRSEPLPTKWTNLVPGDLLETHGFYGTHFIYYKVAAKPGATVTIELHQGDGIAVSAGNQLLPASADKDKTHFSFTLPPNATELVALYENLGHPNFGDDVGQLNGIRSVQGALENVPLAFSTGELDGLEDGRGKAFSSLKTGLDESNWQSVAISSAAPDALLTWYRLKFELPASNPKIWVPWHLHLEAQGNGFLYLNGHGLGRYWQAGLQHDFYLPECWLNFSPGKTNVLALNLRPLDKGVSIQAASIAPDAAFAEKR